MSKVLFIYSENESITSLACIPKRNFSVIFSDSMKKNNWSFYYMDFTAFPPKFFSCKVITWNKFGFSVGCLIETIIKPRDVDEFRL